MHPSYFWACSYITSWNPQNNRLNNQHCPHFPNEMDLLQVKLPGKGKQGACTQAPWLQDLCLQSIHHRSKKTACHPHQKKENMFPGSSTPSWTGFIICRKLCRWIWDHSTQINELPVYTRASLFSLLLLLTSRLTLQSALLPSQDLNPMKYSTQGCARCSELLLEICCLYLSHVWNISYRWESEVLNDKENNVSVRWWW